VLLIAGVLSLTAAARFVFRLQRLDAVDPARLVSQLRLSLAASILLATTGGLRLGLAVANDGQPLARLDLFIGVATVLLAATVLALEPRQALRLSAGGFFLLAVVELAPRAAGMPAALAPQWLVIGGGAYDLCAAALCFLASRR